MSVCLGKRVDNGVVEYGQGTDVDLHPVNLYLAVACMSHLAKFAPELQKVQLYQWVHLSCQMGECATLKGVIEFS